MDVYCSSFPPSNNRAAIQCVVIMVLSNLSSTTAVSDNWQPGPGGYITKRGERGEWHSCSKMFLGLQAPAEIVR